MFRHILIKLILFLCFCHNLNAQVNENFSDGDFTSNPVWEGDVSNWKVTGFQLNSNASSTLSQTYLATQNSLAQNAEWEFFVTLKFATSSSNYSDIFLISDSANLQGLNSGIFVRIGNTADEISLYRKDAGTITKIIDGADGRVSSTSNNIFKIKVTRTPNNEFKLYDDASGTGNNYAFEGSVIETAYVSSAWFGFLIKFSAANIQKFFFDDIRLNTIVLDTIAPKLDSIWAEDSVHCIVKFSESIDTTTAFNLSNFTLNGMIFPISAKKNLMSNSEIVLKFSTPFSPDILHHLEIQKIKDWGGNILADTTASFRHIVLQNGSIVINEIFADPSPVVGLPGYEFIELWNTSGFDLNLQGMQLTDGSSTATFPNYILPKDSFLIVSSTASLSSYSFFGRNINLSGFPGLNNEADGIQLLDKQNKIIDEVNYDVSYYRNSIKSDGGWTLELVNPKIRCNNKYNWKASENTSYGGTPGKMNSVYDATADTTAPKIIHFEMPDDSTSWVIFNSTMDSISMSKILVTTTLTNVKKTITGKNSDTLILSFDPIQNKTQCTFIFSDAMSCHGIKMRSQSFSFVYDKSFEARFNDIVVSEILVNPLPSMALPNSQYIELYNRGNYSISLKGIKISDGTATAALPDYKLMKDSFVLIAPFTKQSEFSSRNLQVLFVSSFPYLNIESDQLTITDSANKIINAMEYNTKAINNIPKSKGGWSLELVDAHNTCVSAGNWLYSISTEGGTPGKTNSVKGIVNDNLPLRFVRAYNKSDNEIIVLFNKSIDLEASRNKITIEFLPALSSSYTVNYNKNKLNEISILFPVPIFTKDSIYTLTIKNFLDCRGISMDSTSELFGLPSIPKYGEIAINEILFNAKSYGSEFIELYNTTNKIFDLSTVTLTAYNKNGIAGGSIAVSGFPLQLLPNQYVTVAANALDIVQRYYTPTPENIFTNSDWNTLDDDSGLLVIAELNTLAPIDSAGYSKNRHHPFISNDEGVSLERVNYYRDGMNPGNWQSAASNVGYATPSYQNSKYAAVLVSDEFVSLNKTYFTPDNDGVDDELNFSLALPSQNYSLNISVYDINGNEIKKLAKNDIAAVKNYYAWDGSTTTGTLANTGHYILFIQATDANGNTKSKKEVVDLLMK